MIREVVAKNIRKYRKDAGLTQKELGNLINRSTKSIQKYEAYDTNKVVDISLGNIEKIAKALEVNVYDILNKPIENINHIDIPLPEFNYRNKMVGIQSRLENIFFMLMDRYQLTEKESVKIAARFNSTMVGLVDDIEGGE